MNDPGSTAAQRGIAKTRRIPIKVLPAPALRKPDWIRVRLSHSATFRGVKQVLRDLCTRRCPFCDVAHGRPVAPDPQEPGKLAHTVARLGLGHVVITSVDRDDLRDGGAAHFAACNLPVRRYVTPTAFQALEAQARQMGFTHAACGPLVRSSYHADRQAHAAGL